MAKGKKTGGRNFSPGVTGNPKGRPQVPADLKGAREMNRIELERILNRCAFLPFPEIKSLAKSNTAPGFERLIANILKIAIERGDQWRADFLLNRMIGRVREELPRDVTPPALEAPVKKTFTQFCLDAGYPPPYPQQIEMLDFGFGSSDTRLLLGSRNYGKTDYVTILGSGYRIYLDQTYRILIITKEEKRAKSIVAEISSALAKNGVNLEKDTALELRVAGHQGKDHSVEGLSIRSGMRGRHPDLILMDDPVTDEDVSEATRKLVERKYNECHKLCPNILIIGQPAHQHDLYAKLRNLVKKMEVPYGSIPELDCDLEAQRLAGVDEKSIQASYFLKIISDGSSPFERVKYLDRFPAGDTAVAFIDPSHEGGDYTALSIVKAHFQGVAVQGHVWKKAWNHCLEDMIAPLKKTGVKKLAFETNALGDQPIIMLRQILEPLGIGVVGRRSNNNKHSRIMAAGAYAHLIHLSKESDRVYTDQVVQYEYKAKFDDAPDSLATCLEWIGLIRGKT